MKIRIVDKNGDMQFGQSLNNFLSDHPRVVSQLLDSRLKIMDRGMVFRHQ